MLQNIREKFTGKFAIAILVLIGIPFVFVGINYNFIGSSYAAKVDGSDINVNQFEQAYRQQLERNPSWAQLPQQFRVQIRERVLDSLIRNRLVDLYLTGRGYQISDTLLTEAIQRTPDFQLDGKFDKETYFSLLAQNGYEPAQFEALQRRALREDQLQRAIGATAIVTPAEYRRYLNLVAEERRVRLASFGLEGVADQVDITDDMITAFYDDNPTLFQTPESADIEFIDIRRDAVAAGIEISDEELQQYYEESRDRYLQDEQRQARHILILFDDDEDAAEALANELLSRIEAGESFQSLAGEYSRDGGTAANGGDLGVLTKTQLPGELGSAIFAMNAGDVEGPIKTDFGFHIVRLDRILERGPLPLDQVRGDLLAELQNQKADSEFRGLERRVSDALFDTPDLQSIADATGLEVKSADAFTREGGEPFGNNQAAIDAVFDSRVLFDGELSEPVELDANTTAVFRVTAYREASRKPLDEVRDEVIAALREQEAEKIVLDKAESMLQALAGGDDFADAAAQVGATVTGPVSVGRQSEDVDQAVLVEIFTAQKPAPDKPITGRVANISGGYTVYSLEAVLPGRPESIPLAERDAGKLQLAAQAGTADYRAFVQALYNEADIVINDDVLAASDLLQ